MTKEIQEPIRLRTLSLNQYPIIQLALSPDEQTLVCVQKRGEGYALLFFDPHTGKGLRNQRPIIYSRKVLSVHWSKDNTRLYVVLVGSVDWLQKTESGFSFNIEIFVSKSQRGIRSFSDIDLTILSDDLIALVATPGGEVCVLRWNGTEHETICDQSRFRNIPLFSKVIPSPHPSTFLASAGQEIYVFSGQYDAWIATSKDLTFDRLIHEAIWLQNGTWVFLLEDQIVVYEKTSHGVIRRTIFLKGAYFRKMIAVDNETVLVASEDPNYLLAISIPDGKILFEMSGFISPIESMCLFGQGRYLITNTTNHIPFSSLGTTVREHLVQIFDFGAPNLGRNTGFLIPDIDV